MRPKLLRPPFRATDLRFLVKGLYLVNLVLPIFNLNIVRIFYFFVLDI